MADIERVTFTINKNKVDEVEIYHFLQAEKEKGIPFSQSVKKALRRTLATSNSPQQVVDKEISTKSLNTKEVHQEKPLFNGMKGFEAPNSDNFT